MEEKQVTVGNTTYELPRPFVVLATQNPLELGQATNPLTRAQLDRFAASIDIEDLEVHEMDAIDALLESGHKTEPVVDLKDITQAKEAILNVTVPQEEKQRASRIVVALRELGIVDRSESVLGGYRPKMHIVNLAKGVALLDRRQTVKSEDIDAVTPYVLRHRTVLTDRETDKGTPNKVVFRY